jgi:hypothetical protein
MFHGRHVRLISKPTTIAELKQSKNEEIAAIPEQMTRRVMDNLRVRLTVFEKWRETCE